jgi:NAD(P)-dependent dehydrogenase (short-subunit alcohol dehydrogenase family)
MTAKSILITGCSSGIGLCVAEGLRQRGYRVFATARRTTDVMRLSEQGLESLQLDLADSRSIHDAVNEILKRSGGSLDALFNNGAYGQAGAVEDLQRDVIRAQFETNLFGTIELTNRIIALMREQGSGRIIMNSSVLGLVTLPYRGAYSASKFALEALTDTLRLELADSEIAVSLIEPGPIKSRFRANSLEVFKRTIDIDHSAHRRHYEGVLRRLEKPGPAAPFTLPPEAVLKCIIHALESRRPKRRYYVTVPTHLFAILRRVLPNAALDMMLSYISRGENR